MAKIIKKEVAVDKAANVKTVYTNIGNTPLGSIKSLKQRPVKRSHNPTKSKRISHLGF